MLTKPIPSTNEPLPVIGLGTWQTFDVGGDVDARSRLRTVIEELAGVGGAMIDSSPMYGSAEQVVGDLVAGLHARERFFLATKVWTTGRAKGIAEMNDSMRKMRADPADLMQVHNLVDVDTHLDTLEEWKAAGRVRYTGITHYTASAHEAVVRVLERRRVDFVQINYSVAEPEAERTVLPAAQDRGIAVIANRPFATGDLLRRLAKRPLPGFAADLACRTWAELLLKFV
ncbi:MAG TPA: aldo/keto reductase, partial [Gemmatimonadaceae bacterium]|nr:aldo/keto reductase [Gemmatimonadaceae bacterium]